MSRGRSDRVTTRKLVPQAKTVAILVNPSDGPYVDDEVSDARQATGAKGVQLHVITASNEAEIEAELIRVVGSLRQ